MMITPRSFLVSRQTQRPSAPSSADPSPSTSPQNKPITKRKDDRTANIVTTSYSSDPSSTTAMAAKRKASAGTTRSSPTPSPPKTTTTITRPTTPTSPVRIPVSSKLRETAHPQKQHRHGERRPYHSSMYRPSDVHSPDAIPPSVAALLAITAIPPPRGSRSVRRKKSTEGKRMTVESIIERSQESEKEFSLTLSKSPLDMLLSPPDELEADDLSSVCESNLGSALSTRTVSLESMPSLSDSFLTDTLPSIESQYTPSRRRTRQPTRRSLERISSPPGEREDHPLWDSQELALEELDFRVFENTPELPEKKPSRLQFPIRSAFKSNLTASLRALRQAARSFSSLNLPSIPPEDFLTRSLLTVDPKMPYTDERRPPPLQEEPTAELRRYLNPTTSARIEQPTSHSIGPTGRAFTASIQMQTYRVQRSRTNSTISNRSSPSEKTVALEYPVPGPRQREVRDNCDFIRIAVMEMAMRKSGKLSDQRPGRARMALPPRKVSSKPYKIGSDGVPARWVPVTY